MRYRAGTICARPTVYRSNANGTTKHKFVLGGYLNWSQLSGVLCINRTNKTIKLQCNGYRKWIRDIA